MLKRTLLILCFLPHFCFAMSVTDFFYNENQQGYNLLKQHKNASAAAKFSDKNWKAVAYYRDKQYQQAYNEFKQNNSPEGLYNQGNALAHLEKYDEAISAYTKALELKKDYPDAKFNKELLEKLKQQQNSNNNKSDNQKDKSDKNDKSDNKSNKNDKSDKKSDKNNKSDKSDSKNSKDEQDNSKDRSNNSKNKSDNAKDNKQQDKVDSKEKNQEKLNQQKSNAHEDKQATADAKAKQDLEAQSAPKADTSKQTPTQVENSEVKSALSQVPDDPGGLLRNKFLRDYQSGKDND